ncbi:MAG: anti-sigma factor [Thiotrichaceae bacterium]
MLEDGNINQRSVNKVYARIAIVLVMALLALLFTFQKGKSDDNAIQEKESEWKNLVQVRKTIHLHWLRTLNPLVKETDGDLIWNTDLQKGLMRFVNLPKLKEGQYYHLWIYDLHQSTEKPVSGGVFASIKGSREKFYVPIIPEQEIIQPFKFLLTMGNLGDKTFSRSQSLLLAQP